MIVAVNEQEVKRLKDLEGMIVGAAGETVTLSIRRMRDDFSPKSPQPYDKKTAPLKIALPIPSRASSLEDVGLTGCTDFVAYVDPKGAASEIGLKRGDRLISYGGRSLGLGQVSSAVYKKPNEAEVLEWSRKAQRMTGSFKPRFIPAGQAKDLGIAQDAYDKGFEIYAETDLMKKISNPSVISSAWRYSKDETWAGIRMIGIGFKLLFRGEVSMRSIGGPIMIGQLAGMAGEQGPSSFFWMMALISLNLGLINLLPIPVLDGGQLIFIAVEGIIRRPVSLRIKERVMVVGLAMIVMLMLFATWNDISRLIVG
jgi:regulator of sigma E protease